MRGVLCSTTAVLCQQGSLLGPGACIVQSEAEAGPRGVQGEIRVFVTSGTIAQWYFAQQVSLELNGRPVVFLVPVSLPRRRPVAPLMPNSLQLRVSPAVWSGSVAHCENHPRP